MAESRRLRIIQFNPGSYELGFYCNTARRDSKAGLSETREVGQEPLSESEPKANDELSELTPSPVDCASENSRDTCLDCFNFVYFSVCFSIVSKPR